MATPFTSVVSTTDFLNQSLLYEIVYSIYERVQLLPGVSIAVIDPSSFIAGYDVQAESFWRLGMYVPCFAMLDGQDYIGSDGTYYCDAAGAVIGSGANPDVLTCTYCGFTSGVRYATAYDPVGGDDWTTYGDGMFDYSYTDYMGNGIIIGPWNVVDVQTMLKLTRYTTKDGITVTDNNAGFTWGV